MDFSIIEVPSAPITFSSKKTRAYEKRFKEVCYCALYMHGELSYFQAITYLDSTPQLFLQCLKKYGYTLSKEQQIQNRKSLSEGKKKIKEFTAFIEALTISNNFTFSEPYSEALFKKVFLTEGKSFDVLYSSIQKVNQEFPNEFDIRFSGNTYDLCADLIFYFKHKVEIEDPKKLIHYAKFFDNIFDEYENHFFIKSHLGFAVLFDYYFKSYETP